MEKRWYAGASAAAQQRARSIYLALYRLAFRLAGRDFHVYVKDYYTRRGMSFIHDVDDWMGGYHYESISPAQVDAPIRQLGFARVHGAPQRLSIGLFGSRCDEFLFERAS